MPLTNIGSDWMFNASCGLCIILGYVSYIIYTGPLSCILGVITVTNVVKANKEASQLPLCDKEG